MATLMKTIGLIEQIFHNEFIEETQFSELDISLELKLLVEMGYLDVNGDNICTIKNKSIY